LWPSSNGHREEVAPLAPDAVDGPARAVVVTERPVVPQKRRASRGLSWIGIGAMKSGTTWFADMLVSHPDVTFAANGEKEQKVLQHPLLTSVDIDRYLALFDVDDGYVGEWTPAYMRCPWSAHVVASISDGPVFAIVRDPVQRFASAMQQAKMRGLKDDAWFGWAQQQVWAGMYAAQLDVWEQAVGDRLFVMQYEQVLDDPASWVQRAWKKIGVKPVAIDPQVIRGPVRTLETELRNHLERVYRADADRLERWGIDTDLWFT
jgi:hypothetical protein